MTQPIRHRRRLHAINTAHLESRERVLHAAHQVRRADQQEAPDTSGQDLAIDVLIILGWILTGACGLVAIGLLIWS